MFSRKVSIALRVLIVVTALIVCGVVGVFLGYNYVLSQNSRFKTLEKNIATKELVINQDTPGAVMIVIRSGDTTSDIADKLKKAGLIKNTMTFSIMSKFNGFDGGYLAGTHFLTPDLTYDEMMYLLCQEPELFQRIEPPDAEWFSSPELKHLYALLLDCARRGAPVSLAAMSEQLSPEEMNLLTGIIQQSDDSTQRSRALADYIQTIRDEALRRDSTDLREAARRMKERKAYGDKV